MKLFTHQIAVRQRVVFPKGFINIQNTGRCHYTALGKRRGSYDLIRLPSCVFPIVFFSLKNPLIIERAPGKICNKLTREK